MTYTNIRKIKIEEGLVVEHGIAILTTNDRPDDEASAAHIFGAEMPATVTMTACKGIFVRPDGVTLYITGAVSNHTATVELPDEAYYYSGAFTLSILVDDVTVRVITGTVMSTSTNTLLESDAIYSLEELQAMIDGKINEPAEEGLNGYVLTTDGNGGRFWRQPAGGTSAGKLAVNSTVYTLRTGESGASGYMTITLEAETEGT